jgi:predicted nucleic acid-binding protein
MSFLLDTNVVSEMVKPKPEARVVAWMEAQVPATLFLPAQTIGELVRGARKIKENDRRARLERWIENDLADQFDGRILPFDDAAAVLWGRLMGDGDRKGQTPAAADAQIAAVALQNELTLVTRNIKDFRRFDLALINPWEETAAP